MPGKALQLGFQPRSEGGIFKAGRKWAKILELTDAHHN
jgi:hypothetical protein